MTTAAEVYRFESFTLDVRRGSLREADREIGLRPKSYAVLRYLVENAGRLLAKDELIAAVWAVTDESIARCISDVRQALGDTRQEIVRTVPRRGYLLSAPVARASPTTATKLRHVPRSRSRTGRRSRSCHLQIIAMIPGRSTSLTE